MVDQGVDGLCILANYSEQFLLSDTERETLTRLSLEHVAGRVPVIVTISHFASDIVVARAQHAKELGANIVMMMAPYHGALMKGSPTQTFEQFARVWRGGDSNHAARRPVIWGRTRCPSAGQNGKID